MYQHNRPCSDQLNEGLRKGDLEKMVEHRFSIDRYKSKMGDDHQVCVLAFTVAEKYPANDLAEFIEKGYNFVLDADVSAGEQRDGKYRVFVEIERDKHLPENIIEVLQGMSKLCDIDTWRFRYFKDTSSYDCTKESLEEYVPLNEREYQYRLKQQQINIIQEMLSVGRAEVKQITESGEITMSKPFAGDLVFDIHAVGDYDEISQQINGAIDMSPSAVSQMVFLEKYLGPCEVHKIDQKFLVKLGNNGMLISTKQW